MMLSFPMPLFSAFVATSMLTKNAVTGRILQGQETRCNYDYGSLDRAYSDEEKACHKAFCEFNYDFRFLHRYEEFYYNESVYASVPYGSYKGPEAILEYVIFAYPQAEIPYIKILL